MLIERERARERARERKRQTHTHTLLFYPAAFSQASTSSGSSSSSGWFNSASWKAQDAQTLSTDHRRAFHTALNPGLSSFYTPLLTPVKMHRILPGVMRPYSGAGLAPLLWSWPCIAVLSLFSVKRAVFAWCCWTLDNQNLSSEVQVTSGNCSRWEKYQKTESVWPGVNRRRCYSNATVQVNTNISLSTLQRNINSLILVFFLLYFCLCALALVHLMRPVTCRA